MTLQFPIIQTIFKRLNIRDRSQRILPDYNARKGCAMFQVVGRSAWRLWFDSKTVRVGFLADIVHWNRFSLDYFGVPFDSIILPLFIHLYA